MVEATPHGGVLEGALLLDLFWILGSVAFVALATRKLNLALIPSYLITGALIGPSCLGAVRSTENLEAISRLAIILLMFGIGLELHLTSLAQGLGRMVTMGGITVGLTVLALWPLGMVGGLGPAGALAVAMALSLSSTAVVMRLLAERREMRLTSSRLTLATLIIQDLAVIGMLAVLPLLVEWTRGVGPVQGVDALEETLPVRDWVGALKLVAMRLAGAGGLIFFGRRVLPALVRLTATRLPPEIMTILAVGSALGAALITQALGFSLELGAFLSGLALASTPFRHHIGGQIAPLRDLFVAVFFTTLGMKVDVPGLKENWWIVLLAAGVVIGVKAVVTAAAAWGLGAAGTVALRMGLNLAQAGEFSMVLLATAGSKGLIDEPTIAVLIAVMVVSLVVAPSVVALGQRLAPLAAWWPPAPWLKLETLTEPREAPASARGSGSRRAIVAGFGPFGRTVAERLEALGIQYSVIEMNPETVRIEREAGRDIVYGDAANAEVLTSAGLDDAEALILTVPDEDAVERAHATAKRLRPDVFVALRVGTLQRAKWAEALGADAIIVEEHAAAEAMTKLITGVMAGRRGG